MLTAGGMWCPNIGTREAPVYRVPSTHLTDRYVRAINEARAAWPDPEPDANDCG